MRSWLVALCVVSLFPACLRAQDLRTVPVSETQLGVERRSFIRRDGSDPERTSSATGLALALRYSLLGQAFPSLVRRRVAVTDWVHVGASWAQVSGRNDLFVADSRVLIPVDLGLQVGQVVGERVQVVGRAGASGGIGITGGMHPFVGLRLRSGALALEWQSLIPSGDDIAGRSVGTLRWYPERLARVGHLVLEAEEVRGKDAALGQRERAHAVRLFLSRER